MGTETAMGKVRQVSSGIVLLLCVMALGLLLVGCAGDDGADGAPGATGATGPPGVGIQGPTGVGLRGPTGPTGVGATGATGAAAPIPAGSAGVSGVVSKGPIGGATVTALGSGTGCTTIGNTATGTPPVCNLGAANVVVSATTAADGSYTLQFPSTYTGPVILQIVGGTYANEVDGTTEAGPAATTPLRAILVTAPLSAASATVAVTPFTTMAAARAFNQAGAAAVTTTIASQANTTVQTMYGIADIIGTLPVDVSKAVPSGATVSAQQYGLLTAALTLQAATLLVPDPLALVNALATDFSADGALDAKGTAGAAITIVGAPTGTVLTSLAGSSGLVTAAGVFAANTTANASGITLDAAVTAATNAASTTSVASTQLRFTTTNNAITLKDSVNSRIQLVSSVTGTTGTMATVSSLASGTITVVVPFALIEGTLSSTSAFTFTLCPSTGLALTACSATDTRSITVTLSKVTLTPSGASVIVSIPSDATVNFTGTSSAGTSILALTTPLAPGTIFTTAATAPSELTFNPNALIAASLASTTAFTSLLKTGNFAYTVTPGLNVFFRTPGVALTCTAADVASTACKSVTLLQGAVQLL